MTLHDVPAGLQGELWALLEALFPLNRTVAGPAWRESLALIGKVVPVRTLEFASGTRCGSWTIPDEWSVNEAYIARTSGERVIDYRSSPFHVTQYSRPFRGRVQRAELLEHVSVHPRSGDAIPLDVTVYRDRWGFAMTQSQRAALTDDEYDVVVDTKLGKGVLRIGELFLPGESAETVVIDAVLSCPSLANNLSGVVAAVYAARELAALPRRRLSWRLLLTPETIGPIALHFLAPDMLKDVIGGVTLVNLADRGTVLHYKTSRLGWSPVDRAMAHSLRHAGVEYRIAPYDVRTGTCGNEKAFNSLGIEAPIGALRRTPLGGYPEYDTSLDNLSFVSRDHLLESFRILWGAIATLERSRVWKRTFEGEPFLTGYGLFPKIANDHDRMPWDYLMGFADGRESLEQIADRAGLPVSAFEEPVRLMAEKGLIREVR